jgi:hypothetical protein
VSSKSVLDRRTNGVGIHQDHFIDVHLAEAEGLLADVFDRRPIGKQADMVEPDALAGGQRPRHGVGVAGFNADDPGLRPDPLDVGGNARDQAAAADAAEHGMNRLGVLAEDLHADRPLAGDHLRVVERVHEAQLLGFLEFAGAREGVVERLPDQHHFTAKGSHRLDFDLRRRRRHDDHRPTTELGRRQRHALRMITGRRADHAAFQLVGREVERSCCRRRAA